MPIYPRFMNAYKMCFICTLLTYITRAVYIIHNDSSDKTIDDTKVAEKPKSEIIQKLASRYSSDRGNNNIKAI